METDEIIHYIQFLFTQERAPNTLKKYRHDLENLQNFLGNLPPSKELLLLWKKKLAEKFAPRTVNSMLAAVNGFLSFLGRRELCVKPLKIQKNLFAEERKELTKAEYIRLIQAAKQRKNHRLALVIETICATGIRVSELRFITVEAVRCGRAEITNKGKRRIVFLPSKLRRLLDNYAQKEKITADAVFVTRGKKPLDRSNIWREMKLLCEAARVDKSKVFPHNLRHLFARTFYSMEKDLSRLADILGHSSINTTRIYTMESGRVHAEKLERLGLVPG